MKKIALIAENLCKNYGKGDTVVHALNDVSLTLHAGEIAALLGPSGAGKSWGIYNQIRTHSPFCKRLIIKHSQVTHKIKWRILQFSREFSQRFR